MCFSHGLKLYYTTGINENDVRLKETWKHDPTVSFLESSINSPLISPNPTTGIVQIITNENVGVIEIYSALGELLFIRTNTTSVDISNYKEGVYFLKIHLDDEVIQTRIVKI